MRPVHPESLWPARFNIMVVIGLNLALGEHLTVGAHLSTAHP